MYTKHFRNFLNIRAEIIDEMHFYMLAEFLIENHDSNELLFDLMIRFVIQWLFSFTQFIYFSTRIKYIAVIWLLIDKPNQLMSVNNVKYILE